MSSKNLLLALEDAHKTYSFYAQASLLAGEEQRVFVALKNAKNAHIDVISAHLQDLNVAIPRNPFVESMAVVNSAQEALHCALMQENASIALFNSLLANEQNPMVIDLFYRLQAESFNHHIPLLQNALLHTKKVENIGDGAGQTNFIKGASSGVNAFKGAENVMDTFNNGKAILEETGEMVAKLKEGTLSQEQLEGFLSKLNYSLVGGVIAGAFCVIIFNEFLNQNKE